MNAQKYAESIKFLINELQRILDDKEKREKLSQRSLQELGSGLQQIDTDLDSMLSWAQDEINEA